jgi:phosphoserine phosphatase
MSDGLRLEAVEFIESVMVLQPAISVFDCDGTLWSGDAGADFFYWEIEQGIVDPDTGEWARARYDEYKAGRVSEEQICGEMVTINRRLPYHKLLRAAQQFFDEAISQRIFPEMQELARRLSQLGSQLWAVSSTNNWVVEVGAERFGIPREHVLAACVHLEDGYATDRLVRVPTDELKAVAIREVIGRPVDAVFGNSIHDLAMLEMARSPFCVNPNPDLAEVARQRRWPVYQPSIIAY